MAMMLRSAVTRVARRAVPEKESLLILLRGPRSNHAAAQSAEVTALTRPLCNFFGLIWPCYVCVCSICKERAILAV